MSQKIWLKRGKSENIPMLDVGEPAFTVDTKRLYVGSETGNIEIANKSDIDMANNRIEGIERVTARLTHLLSYEVDSGYQEDIVKQGWLQGFCVVNNNIVLARISSYKESNDVVLTEISMDTMSVVREKILPLGHANDLDFIPHTSEIVCTPMQFYTDDGVKWASQLIFIDYETLTIKKIVETPTIATGVAYDPITGELAYKNGRLVYYLDEDYEVIREIRCDKVAEDIGQGMALYNGYVYMNRSQPETIQVFNNNGGIVTIYDVGRFTDEGINIYETESIKPIGNGRFLVGATKAKDDKYKKSVFDFFVMDGRRDIRPKTTYLQSNRHNSRIAEIYVDSSYNKLDSDGTENKPFPDIQYALNVCNDPTFNYIINIAAGNYGHATLWYTANKITIRGAGHNTVIEGIRLLGCKYVEINDVTIVKYPDDTSVRVNDSSLRLTNVGVKGTGDSGGITISNTRLFIDGKSYVADCRNGIYINNGSIVTINNGVYFENCSSTELYAVAGSFVYVNSDVSIDYTKIRINTGANVRHGNSDFIGALYHYGSKGIVMDYKNISGVIQNKTTMSLDDIDYTGKYYIHSNPENSPSETSSVYLDVITTDKGHTVQRVWDTSPTDFRQWVRKGTKSGDSITWGEWKVLTYE